MKSYKLSLHRKRGCKIPPGRLSSAVPEETESVGSSAEPQPSLVLREASGSHLCIGLILLGDTGKNSSPKVHTQPLHGFSASCFTGQLRMFFVQKSPTVSLLGVIVSK